MSKVVVGLFILLLFGPISVFAQSKIDDGIQYPSEEQLAASRRLHDLLAKPDAFTLRLLYDNTPSKPDETPRPYTVGDRMYFKMFVMQSLSESLWMVDNLLPACEYRPELYKAGDILEFSKGIKERVIACEHGPFALSSSPFTMVPGRQYELPTFDLADWYDPLGPGHYQLSIRKRFVWDGEWGQSNSITFEVVPRRVTPQRQNANQRPDPIVTTQVQPESPLTIVAKPRWFDQKIFEIYVVVKSIADKPVTAYATTSSNVSVPNSQKACFIYSFPGPGKRLTRDKSDGKSQWNQTDSENKTPQLEFGVDFVEFADGSTWGIDFCQAKEYLDGYRSGVRAARKLFKVMLAEVGGEQLIAELKEGPVKIDEPLGKSDRWIKAFRSGIEGMCSSVLRAYEERGLPEIDIELSRPIDASENPETR